MSVGQKIKIVSREIMLDPSKTLGIFVLQIKSICIGGISVLSVTSNLLLPIILIIFFWSTTVQNKIGFQMCHPSPTHSLIFLPVLICSYACSYLSNFVEWRSAEIIYDFLTHMTFEVSPTQHSLKETPQHISLLWLKNTEKSSTRMGGSAWRTFRLLRKCSTNS